MHLDPVITDNLIQENGKNPDPRTQGPGDLVYLDDPTNGSYTANNVFKTTDYPFGPPPACT